MRRRKLRRKRETKKRQMPARFDRYFQAGRCVASEKAYCRKRENPYCEDGGNQREGIL